MPELPEGLEGWKKLLKNLASLTQLEVRVGLQGAKGDEAHPGGELSNSQIGAIHEFSGPGDKPPGRPFIRPPLYEREAYWKKRLADLVKEILEKGGNVNQAYRTVGEEYRKAIIDRMKAGIAPPLADSTLKARNPGGAAAYAKREAKGRLDTVPLIDTGALMGAISVVVEKKSA